MPKPMMAKVIVTSTLMSSTKSSFLSLLSRCRLRVCPRSCLLGAGYHANNRRHGGLGGFSRRDLSTGSCRSEPRRLGGGRSRMSKLRPPPLKVMQTPLSARGYQA